MTAKNFFADGDKIHPTLIAETPIHVSKGAEIHANAKLGRYTLIGINSVIYPNVVIGRYCSIARNVEVGVAQHPTKFLSTHAFQISNNAFSDDEDYSAINHVKAEWFHKPVSIGNDVLLGAKVIVLPGVNIGHGAIVASGSVVSKDVLPYEIVGGVPAKRIAFRFEQSVISELLELCWWDLDIKFLKNIKFNDINVALRQLRDILFFLEKK